MEGDKDYSVVSKKDLMPSLLLHLMNNASEAYARSEHDSSISKIFRGYVQQMKVVLNRNISKLEKKDQALFQAPEEGYGRADRDQWRELQLNLWDLAIASGHAGVDEKEVDFQGLVDTLKSGVIYHGK